MKPAKTWQKELGKRLRRAREERRLSVLELEAKSGVSRQNIYNYESGVITPGFDKMAMIIRVLRKITLVIDGNSIEISAEDFPHKPQSVPKQLRMEVICDPGHALLKPVKSSRAKNRVVIDAVLSA